MEANVYTDPRGYRHCRECRRIESHARSAEAAAMRREGRRRRSRDEVLAAEFGFTITPHDPAERREWIGRRLRERAGIEPTRTDHVQLIRAMTDTNAFQPELSLGPKFAGEE